MAKHVRHVTAPFTYHGTPGELVVRVKPAPISPGLWDVAYAGTIIYSSRDKKKALQRAKDAAEAHGARVEIVDA